MYGEVSHLNHNIFRHFYIDKNIPPQPTITRMPVHPISPTALDLATTTHSNKPIYMLNLWRYRPQAIYPSAHAHLSPSPCTGEEAMLRYRAAITAVLPEGATIHFQGKPIANIAAPEGEEKWDQAVVVKYRDVEGFRRMVESREYKENVEGHRLAGLVEWRLICCERVDGGEGEVE